MAVIVLKDKYIRLIIESLKLKKDKIHEDNPHMYERGLSSLHLNEINELEDIQEIIVALEEY